MSLPNPDDFGPVLRVIFRGGLVIAAPILKWMVGQRRVLALVEEIYGNAPLPLPDPEWRELVGDWIEQSQARRPRDAELDELETRLLVHLDLEARFVS